MKKACTVLGIYPNPVEMTALALASSGHKLLQDYHDFLEEIDGSLEQAGLLTLGLNDFHAATSSSVETFIYKLGQRIKSELEN
jgi:hypothetical protein